MNADSDPPDRPPFGTVDWETLSTTSRPSVSWPTWGLVCTLALLLSFFTYDTLLLKAGDAIVFGWKMTPMNWLFVLSVVVLTWVFLVSVVSRPDRLASIRTRLASDPLALACVAYLGLFCAAGLAGLYFSGRWPTPGYAHQPPLFFTTPETAISNCYGVLESGQCHATSSHPLGTDNHGRSMLRILAEGAYVSLQVVLIVGMLACSLALLVGSVAGYAGGRIDTILMRYVDVQQAVPAFVVYIVLIYVFGSSLFLFVLVFGLLNWGGIARVIRSEVLRITAEPYVQAARTYGSSHTRIIRRHVLPNVAGTAVVAGTQLMPRVLLIEAALSFLTLTSANVQSWGHTISVSFQSVHPFATTWWISTFPVAFLASTVIAFAVLGDRLRDVSDPNANQ